MSILMDKARELVSLAEAEIEKREITIVGLKREVAGLKDDLLLAKDRRLAVQSSRCSGCAYRVIALKQLEKEEKVKAK